MICKLCKGKGWAQGQAPDIPTACPACGGKGFIDITNEEWFCQLPTEEKAKVFTNATYSSAETPLSILWGGKEAEQKKWEMWLKQPHTIKE